MADIPAMAFEVSTMPFDPNDGMFFASPDEESSFAKTPANVTNDFIKEAKQNLASLPSSAPSAVTSAAPSATASEVRSTRDLGGTTPKSIPSRPATVAAAVAPATKRKRFTKLKVSNADEYPGVSTTQAAAPARSVTPPEVPSNIQSSLPPPKKRKRQAGKKQLNSRVIPRSLDECDDADKELITMREAGNEWKTIRTRWAEMTGEQTATSTLPNRYARLKYVI